MPTRSASQVATNTPLTKDDPVYPTLASAQHLTCWHAFYDAVPVALCLIDPQLRILSSNRRMAEILAHYPQDVVGRSLSEVVPGIAAQLEPHLRQALSSTLAIRRRDKGRKPRRAGALAGVLRRCRWAGI
jgi:PAS domain S-box-containing protein